MSRQLFQRWSSGLRPGQFAQAIAAGALFGRELPSPGTPDFERVVRARLDGRTGIVSLRERDLAFLARALRDRRPPTGRAASDYLKAWQEVRALAAGADRTLLRLMLSPAAHDSGITASWLAAQLGHPDVGASSVFIRGDRPSFAVGWNWPIRIGVLAGRASLALRGWLGKHSYAHLTEVIEVDSRGGECDLLLLGADLRGALAQLLAARRVRADCVLVLGELSDRRFRYGALLASLRAEARASGVAVLAVPIDERPKWFKELIRELAHDNPLDVALWLAAASVKAPQPHIEASLHLMRFSRLAETARRMSDYLIRAVAPAAPQAKPVGAKLESIASRGDFGRESADASEIVNQRKDAEARTGAPMRLVRADGAPAPARKPAPDQRRVNFELYDVTETPSRSRLKRSPLRPERRYDLGIFIGLPRKDIEGADQPFPSEKLPPSPTGHQLDVMFCPLTRDQRGELAEPQRSSIFLPPEADSTSCTFAFDTLDVKDAFHARLIIAHRNRVAQTLMFSAGVDDRGKGEPAKLAVEAIVAPDFNTLAYRSEIDAAVIVNHSPAGSFGASVLADGEITYDEPDGIKKCIDDIKALLKKVASREAPYESINDPELRELLSDLARHGRAMWFELDPRARQLLANADVIQVIDARPGAYLPLEFFFADAPPAEGSEVCPRAAEFLASDAPHRDCPHLEDGQYQCPLRFWGFQRVIERQTVYATTATGEFRLSCPTPERNRIHALQRALVGSSDNVRLQDLASLRQELASRCEGVLDAKDWDAWIRKIKAQSPTLLMLLPHSDKVPPRKKFDGLEIGGSYVEAGGILATHVAGPGSPNPVVFLLGCSTGLPDDLPFVNFVRYFKENAALVMGTLSTIRGRRTVPFVKQLLAALSGGESTFGEALLKARRRLLASGDAFALTLIAYGDSDWIV